MSRHHKGAGYQRGSLGTRTAGPAAMWENSQVAAASRRCAVTVTLRAPSLCFAESLPKSSKAKTFRMLPGQKPVPCWITLCWGSSVGRWVT